ncbi:MAG: LuxR C-terminal-related transcriptional regulator, partial [Burkholderiales bacterium]
EQFAAGGDAVLVLRGVCLPLVAFTVPFIGFRSALRLPAGVVSATLPSPPDLDDMPARVPVLIDRWLDQITQERHVVLTIDDVQWADQDTLDTLLYLAAGPAARHLAILATVRSPQSEVSGPVDRWIAELRRMPRVEFLGLEPLDRAATAEQVSTLLGWPPDESLVDDVFDKTRGHPYLTELSVAGLSPGSTRLPPDLPESVRSAVLGTFRSLAPDTRTALTALAVAGRPLRPSELSRVLDAGGMSAGAEETLRGCLVEALHAAVVVEGEAGLWFRHPLTPELLHEDLAPGERRRWHALLARFEEDSDLQPGSEFAHALRVAEHHHQAATPDSAYRFGLAAARLARGAGAYEQELRLLLRALDLSTSMDADSETRQALLGRAQRAAMAAHALDEELRIVDEILASAELPDLARAEYLIRRITLRAITQREIPGVEACTQVLTLTAKEPTSAQHVRALSRWVDAQVDLQSPPSPPVVDASFTALTTAREIADPGALANALEAAAWVQLMLGNRARAAELAEEAGDAALVAHEWVLFNNSVYCAIQSTTGWLTPGSVRIMRRRRMDLVAANAPHGYVAWLAASESHDALTIGAWEHCAEVLRYIRSRDPGLYSNTSARITAARLAVLQGRQAEAESHIQRVEELSREYSSFLLAPLDSVRSEVLLAAGDAEGGFAAAMMGFQRPELPELAEWLLPLAARALADLAAREQSAGRNHDLVLTRIDELADAHPEVVFNVPPVADVGPLRETGLNLLYKSEISRAHATKEEPDNWLRTADALADALLPWEEAYACQRLAESLLRGAGGARRVGAARLAIHRGLGIAEQLRANPVTTALNQLAKLANITLTEISMSPERPSLEAVELQLPPRFSTLTDREREVLAHIVSGETYAEVAAALFISEKTVSAHVSHLLTKTGATNRIELAQLVISRS